MELAIQLMMGLSLAACTGIRTWLPMLVVGMLARSQTFPLHLNPSFNFLSSDGVLIALAVLAVLELLGDKVIAIDHMLDAVGTFIRPAAGTILASSMFVSMDPTTATLLGLFAGGGTALTMHAGKTLARAKVSAFSPLHLGAGNAFVSVVEDIVSGIGIIMSILLPVITFFLTLLAACGAVALIILAIKHGKRVFTRFGASEPLPVQAKAG